MTDPTNYEIADIEIDAQLGEEPSAGYLKSVEMLDNAVRECMYVSKGYAGIKSPSSRHYYASVLFTALITRGVSLAILMPHTPWAEKVIEHWDYASAAGVVRTMLELRIAFFYLCVDPCSEDEWQTRWNIFNLHDCVSRIRLFDAADEIPAQEGLKLQADELRARLTSNTYFQSLPDGQRKKFLHGQSAYLFALEEIAERSGVEIKNFRLIYLLFSSHVHGLPMSFYRIGAGAEERGRGLPSPVEKHYTSLCLSLASKFLVSTRDELKHLFLDFRKQADLKIATLSEQGATVQTPAGNSMVVGEMKVFAETDDLQIEVVKIDDSELEIHYRHKLTGEAVLRRVESEAGNYLTYLDLAFWNIFLNGDAVTEQQLAVIEGKSYAFQVNHKSRTLHFKI